MEKLSFEKRNLLLQLQEGTFAVEAACITGEAAVRADNTVAGDDNGDGVAPHGTAHRLRRAATDAASQFAVGHRLSVGDSKQGLPNTLLEWCASQQKVWGEIRFLSGEKDVEPTEGIIENR